MTENEAKKWVRAISATQSESNHTSSLESRKEALYMAIKALEEIQQYRAIGTVEQLEWCKDASHWKELFKEKLEKYEAIGTVEELKELKDEQQNKCKDCAGCTMWKCDCVNERAYAIDEFVKEICKKYTEEESKGNCRQYCVNIKQDIADMAEQMKAGGTDGNK